MKKVFILAGEPSGDLHASFLIKALLKQKSELEIKAWGGDKMQSAGAEVLRTLDHLAFMGFVEVAKNFNSILTNFRLCKEQITNFDPDLIVFVDYPGFNLRMAKWTKEKGYKTIQYIAPAAWAWKENRVKNIKKYVDELLVILPFEKEFFAKHGIDAHYVGHPLVEEIDAWEPDPDFKLGNQDNSPKSIALFPGSRMQELKLILPKMIALIKEKTDLQFHIAVPDHISKSFYQSYITDIDNVHLVQGRNYDLLSVVDAAIVTSGTATLEVALFDVPQVVCYETNPISFSIAKRLVKTQYISLVNLIAGKEVVRELIQGEFSTSQLINSLNKLLDKSLNKNLSSDYKELRYKLGNKKSSEEATKIILSFLSLS